VAGEPLFNGAILRRSSLPPNLNIRVDTFPALVGSDMQSAVTGSPVAKVDLLLEPGPVMERAREC
jgi:hypothetical protein